MDPINKPINKLDLLLRDYLIQHTNYALLLTAHWGAGKTYYLKNHFFNNIEDTGYQPILVSLFGIKSIDDIKDRIFTELYPKLESKGLKLTKTVLKVVAKSIDITNLFGNGILSNVIDTVGEGIDDLKAQKKENLAFDKMLICFDDLERANPGLLTSSEILGYINSLVEDDNIKVIIVANEGKMESENYLVVKEKTIGNTIHFDQNFNDVFLNILEKGDQPVVYRNFLKTHQQIVHDFLSIDEKYEKGKLNYRTLTYFISYFSQIFQLVEKGFGIEDLDKDKGQLLTSLLKFSLFVCNEYKKGFFSFSDRKGFDDATTLMMQRYLDAKVKDMDTKSGRALHIADAYFPNQEFNFYESIYDYLTGGDFFDKSRFIAEVKQEYHVVDDNISDAYKVYNKLSNVKYRDFSDQEFRKLTREMKNFALAGKYEIQDYISVLYYVLRHGNVLSLDNDKLARQLISQIRKKAKNHVYHPLIEKYTSVSEEAEFYEWSKQLRDEILKVNTKSALSGRSQVVAQMERDLLYNYDALHEQMIKDCNTPFVVASFSGVRAAKFFAAFQSGSNKKKSMMEILIRVIYMPRHGNNSAGDLKFLQDLEGLIVGKLALPNKNISGLLYDELLKGVKRAITEIIPYQPVAIGEVGQ